MKKLFLVVGLVIGFVAFAYAQSASEVAKQVTTELQDSGVITAQDAPSVSSSVKTLVKSGASADDAKNIVARAAHQAKAQGLKGKELAAKVHEAVKARKAQLDEVKKKAKEEKRRAKQVEKEVKEAERKAKKASEETEEKTREEHQKAGKEANKGKGKGKD